MPVRPYRQQQSQDHQVLSQELAREWLHPQTGDVAQPTILEEFDSSGDLNHVYVVWKAWSHLERVERGEIIMEAAEERYGRDGTTNVTIAMGLTPAEADQMKLIWQ